ncbi:MAG: PulJ/GspJ family protein [Gemmatimonadales bacterium]
MTAPTRSSRGFTLVETLIAMVLLGLVSVVIYKMLITTQRVTDAQAERGDLQASLRAGALAVPSELRQIALSTSSAFDSIADIRAVTDTSITYRSMRGYYMICGTPASATTVIVSDSIPSAFASEYRAPTTSDSALVFWEGDSTITSDDHWIPVAITAVARATNSCTFPSGAGPGYTLTVSSLTSRSGLAFAKIYAGSPVRTWETVQLTLYASSGQQWLGMSVNGGTTQPVMGPLAPTAGGVYGFQLTYFDSTGTALTASSASIPKIRSIRVALRGVTEGAVALAGKTRSIIQDSLVTTITPRNTPFN